MRLIFITLFGLESMVKQELVALGFDEVKLAVTNGSVAYETGEDTPLSVLELYLSAANLYLGACERIYLEIAEFPQVLDFDSYFDNIAALGWEAWRAADSPIIVDAYSLDSRLNSIPALQRSAKKAIVSRLQQAYGLAPSATVNEDPEAPAFEVQIVLNKNTLAVRLDSSARPLHKRGYRKLSSLAPLKETLAYGILQVLHWPKAGGAAVARRNYLAALQAAMQPTAALTEGDSDEGFTVEQAAGAELEAPSMAQAASLLRTAMSGSSSATMAETSASAGSNTGTDAMAKGLDMVATRESAVTDTEAGEHEALVSLLVKSIAARMRAEEVLVDIFTGSGTFAIEAAMRLLSRAPGLSLDFAFTHWLPFRAQKWFTLEKRLASAIYHTRLSLQKNVKLPIYARDIDAIVLNKAERNAASFGLADYINFEAVAAADFNVHDVTARASADLQLNEDLRLNIGSQSNADKNLDADNKPASDRADGRRCLVLGNPPYGERLADKAAVVALLQSLRSELFKSNGELQDNLRFAFIHLADNTMQALGYHADKKRKLYNGNIPCYLYQFYKRGMRTPCKDSAGLLKERKYGNYRGVGADKVFKQGREHGRRGTVTPVASKRLKREK